MMDSIIDWIIEQLTVLAEAFAVPLTAARLRIYAENLADLDRHQLARAIGRAVRESRFFPNVAELRQLAGADAELQTHLEAEAAWQQVERDLAHRGRDAPPGLDPRTEYAIQCVGGRRAIDRIWKDPDTTTETFKKKDFIEAFANYDAAKVLGLHELAAPVRQLLTAGAEDRPKLELLPGSKQAAAPTWKPSAKPIPQPLSDGELEARRALLAEQARKLQANG